MTITVNLVSSICQLTCHQKNRLKSIEMACWLFWDKNFEQNCPSATKYLQNQSKFKFIWTFLKKKKLRRLSELTDFKWTLSDCIISVQVLADIKRIEDWKIWRKKGSKVKMLDSWKGYEVGKLLRFRILGLNTNSFSTAFDYWFQLSVFSPLFLSTFFRPNLTSSAL